MIKKALAGLCLSAMLVGASVLPAAAAHEITVFNQAPDAWVWVTAYEMSILSGGRRIVKAWCVAPGQTDKRHFGEIITYLRGEVTRKDCAHPVLADNTVQEGLGASWMHGDVKKYSDGAYRFLVSSGN